MKKIDKNKIKTWFVTGASSGIGYELSNQLISKGYNVVAVSRRKPDLCGEGVLCLSVDVRDINAVKNACDEGIKKFRK